MGWFLYDRNLRMKELNHSKPLFPSLELLISPKIRLTYNVAVISHELKSNFK